MCFRYGQDETCEKGHVRSEGDKPCGYLGSYPRKWEQCWKGRLGVRGASRGFPSEAEPV